MKFTYCEDVKALENICRKSGSDRVKKSSAFLRTAFWYSREKRNFIAETIDDIAFYAGTFCKSHFTLVDCAVVKERHGEGIGTIISIKDETKMPRTQYSPDKIAYINE